jgi:hypothetical protein
MLPDIYNNKFEITKEFAEKIQLFKNEWYEKIREISNTNTPELDGAGRKIVNGKGDTGYKYISDSYMHSALDKYFPGWSWEMASPLQFLGSEWVVAQGNLKIIDEHLLVFGINPPYRAYYGVDAVRIQFKKDMPHTPENIIDIGDNCKQANTNALKLAINRLTHIGDDIYGKQVETEGMGSLEDIIKNNGVNASDAFYKYITSKHLLIGKVKEVLKAKANINSLSDIKDYGKAKEILDNELKK